MRHPRLTIVKARCWLLSAKWTDRMLSGKP
jgi:hypothetical protein